MKLIVGLGNPTKKYEGTRHNVGFAVIDALAEQYGISVTDSRGKALLGTGRIEGEKVILAKPQTYMNLSGESVRALMDYYRLEKEDLLVIYDDVSLPVGQLRARAGGSCGGHNGMKNIIARLDSQEFSRLRLGVGEKPPRMDLADYVLGHFHGEEKEVIDEGISHATKAVASFVCQGIEETMNCYNVRQRKEKGKS